MNRVDAEQLQIRPALRVIGAILMLLIAALMIYSAALLFSAEKVLLKSCVGEYKASSRLLCEIGNAMLSMLPARMQGPVEALIHLAMAALLICFSWLLTRRLWARSQKESSLRRL